MQTSLSSKQATVKLFASFVPWFFLPCVLLFSPSLIEAATVLLGHWPTHSVINAFVLSLTHSCVATDSFNHWLSHWPIHYVTNSLTLSLIRFPGHWPFHSVTNSLTLSLIHFPGHWPFHSVTNSLTLSLTRSPRHWPFMCSDWLTHSVTDSFT